MCTRHSWYLIRTKSNRESYVRDQLSHVVPEVFLPMLDLSTARVRARAASTMVPLFPQYVFARLDLSVHYFAIRYMSGVVGFVCAGYDPLPVSEGIVNGVRDRCTDGVVQLRPMPFYRGERVRIVDGPFRDFEAIFESYLSGAKRVAILIQAVEGRSLRAIADAAVIAKY